MWPRYNNYIDNMSSDIKAKQKVDLNFAIQQYLLKEGHNKAAETFAKEANVDHDAYLATSTQPPALLKDILERKWTSIARLKKQEMDY